MPFSLFVCYRTDGMLAVWVPLFFFEDALRMAGDISTKGGNESAFYLLCEPTAP